MFYSRPMTELRTTRHHIEFPYTRSLGPVIGPFLAALRDRRILGIRSGDRVLVPPMEYDPETGDGLGTELVEVGPAGEVTSWAWVSTPSDKHPLSHPFALALIRLDGADTAMLHAVDAGSMDAMRTGMRVAPRWKAERLGRIDDIEAFVPETTAPAAASERSRASEGERATADGVSPPAASEPDVQVDQMMEFFMSLTYTDVLSPPVRRYAAALERGKFLGQRCPICGLVYVPPRGYCPIDVIELGDEHELELADRGVVTNYTIVTPVQYYGQKETEPFVRASILLDGEGGMLNLQDILDVANDQVRIGMRVEAVWKPEGERDTSELTNRSWGSAEGAILGFRPTGEPDVDPAAFKTKVF